MKSLTASRATAIALSAALTIVMSLGSNLFAQTDGSGTRFPLLQGPAIQGPTLQGPLDGSANRAEAELPMFDALGNLVDTPTAESFEQRNFQPSDFAPALEPARPQLPNETYAEPLAQEYRNPEYITPEKFDSRDQFQQPQPPAIVERARPLPPRENFHQSPNAFPYAGPTERRGYSQADIARALQRLAVMEQLLRQQLIQEQLRRETALRYSTRVGYPNKAGYTNGVRYSRQARPSQGGRPSNRGQCGNSPRGGYAGPYGRPGGY